MLLARFEFGARGEVVRVTNNAFSPEMIGDVLYPDGRRHDTVQPGAGYVVESYGVELNDDVTCSAYGNVFFGPLAAGTVEIAFHARMNDAGDEAIGWSVISMDIEAALFADFCGTQCRCNWRYHARALGVPIRDCT